MRASHDPPAGGPIPLRLALFLRSCALAAVGTASLGWAYLPYEALKRFSPEERFQAWEGVVWMLALALVFLGLACVLQVVGWRPRGGITELRRRLRAPIQGRELLVVAVVLPWWMITCGLLLIAVATLARSSFAP